VLIVQAVFVTLQWCCSQNCCAMTVGIGSELLTPRAVQFVI